MVQLIHLYLKVKFLAVLLVFNFLVVSCKSSRVVRSTDELNSIINKEINFFETSDTIFVKQGYENAFLISFLEEFNVSFTTNSLKDEEIKNMLTPSEIAYLKKQLKKNELPLEKFLQGHDKIKLLKPEPKGEGSKNGLQIAQEYTRNKIVFSSPIMTSTKDYALIFVSKGMEDAMSSSIHVYKKIGGQWKYYTRIYDAIE